MKAENKPTFKKKNIFQRAFMPLEELETYYREKRKYEQDKEIKYISIRKCFHPIMVFILFIRRPRLKADELLHSITETNSKVVFATEMTVPEIMNVMKKTEIQVIQISPVESAPLPVQLFVIKKKTHDMLISWKKFIKTGANYNDTIDVAFEKDSVITIVHTGGTTGVPKGVMLTNENFNAMALIHEISGFDQRPKDRFITFLPPFIAYCLANAINDPLYLGLEVTIIPKFDYKEFPKLIMRHRPNHVLGGPILWEYFIRSELTQNADLSFLKSPVSGGDVMNIQLEHRINCFFKKHNCEIKIQQGYGMSEVAAAACISTNSSYCAGSVGIPFIKNLISIFDVNTGEELSYGREGEVCIQSPTTMKGYYNNTDATNELIRIHKDGKRWVHTGDLGVMNENGNLFIKGRMKRMIVRSGNKIFPQTIESIIMGHKNVIDCAVVQMNHNEDRYVPVAFVILKDNNSVENTVNEIELLIYDKMPEFNIPYKWIIKSQLALTSINKIDFKALEKEAALYENADEKIIVPSETYLH